MLSSSKCLAVGSAPLRRCQKPQAQPSIENHEDSQWQAGAKGPRDIAIVFHRRAMRQDHGNDMAEDDEPGLAQPDHPHGLAVIEKSGGDVKIGQAEIVGAGGERIIQRDKDILAVNQKRGQVMRGVVGQRDRQDCRGEQ